MKKTGWLGAGAIVGILVLLACSCATREADRAGWREKEEQTARIASGGRLFAAYCTSCHGADARGHGPAAAALKTAPADLTHIAVRAGGTFEAAKVAGFIDGRTRVDAHGEREMPVWGRLYDDRNENLMSDETLLSPGMIFEIVEYLGSIQAPAAR